MKLFLDQKHQFTYPQAFIKNVQVTEEAFSSQKRPSNTSKHELLTIFLLLWCILVLLDPDQDSESGSGSTDPIKSGSNPDPDTDPDLQPCVTLYIFRMLQVPGGPAGRQCRVCTVYRMLQVPGGPSGRQCRVCDVCHTLLVQNSAPYFSMEAPHTD